MTLNNDATLNIGVGHFYLAPLGTVAPVDLSAPEVAWVEIGHTSADNVFGITTEGGDVTTLASLQAKALRTSTAPVIETFAINLLQFDEDSLKLYFGSNAVGANGWLAVPDAIVATKQAFLAIFTDGIEHFGIWAASTEIQRSDAPVFADSTALSSLPIAIKPLNYMNAPSKYSVTELAETP